MKSWHKNSLEAPSHRLAVVPKCKLLPVFLSLALLGSLRSYAGTSQKWEDLPQAVRATILAHGGTAKGRADLESSKMNGLAIYEAAGKDKNGKEVDLVITADGKLQTIKDDDAAERPKEATAEARKALANLKFSHPTEINNPFLPLATLKKDVLEGKEGQTAVRIERIARPDVQRKLKYGKQTIESLAVEDREYESGELSEVALDFFAQADDGTVLYLGEEVDEYKKGKIVGHSGSWMLGKNTKYPGVILPGDPKLGDRFKSEDVSKSIHENDEVVSINESVTTPAGAYQNCIKVKESLADGTVEYKYYAKGVGVVREQPPEGDVLLKTHETR